MSVYYKKIKACTEYSVNLPYLFKYYCIMNYNILVKTIYGYVLCE